MFIIVPKKQAKGPATTALPLQEAQAVTPPAPENGDERGPTRAAVCASLYQYFLPSVC